MAPGDSQHWLSSDLEEKVKNFEEIRQNFINDLTNQMSNLLVTERHRSTTMIQNRSLTLGESSTDKLNTTTTDEKIIHTEEDIAIEEASKEESDMYSSSSDEDNEDDPSLSQS